MVLGVQQIFISFSFKRTLLLPGTGAGRVSSAYKAGSRPTTWARITALPLTSCVILQELLTLCLNFLTGDVWLMILSIVMRDMGEHVLRS